MLVKDLEQLLCDKLWFSNVLLLVLYIIFKDD